ncbi:MAG: LarC family nickel insertion protein, partial [Oscillospiraceae bacterium]|nr:LarC family nickel insertion protein [Oscillospiraceae bacterium]
ATLLTVLCESGEAHRLLETIFSETTTIGLRMREERRICLRRGSETIKTEYGDLKVKTVELFGEKRLAPEYEEAKNLAKKANVPLHKIYESIKNI